MARDSALRPQGVKGFFVGESSRVIVAAMLAPPKLQPGDAVSVVAPSGPFDRPSFEKGVEVLRSFGLRPLFDERLFAKQRYLAGPDSQRLELLEAAIADPTSKAIWCARGGYGAMRLLPSLRLRGLVDSPKLFVGFSDATALHAAWNARGLRTLHAPVLTQLGNQPPDVLERLRGLLFSVAAPAPLAAAPVSTFTPGRARGLLLGGNLSMLSRLVGTPFLPSLSGAVLFFEDVGERPYRLDRLWTHLTLAHALDGVRGVAVGDLTGCEEKEADYRALDVVGDLCRSLGVPAAGGFRVGHGDVNQPLPLGAEVEFDADRGTLTFFEGAVG
jgi:muramoyltetrapeptide carboxypeptidase